MSLAKNGCRDLFDDLSNLTLGFSALPKGLRGCMLSEFADYVVSNLLIWIRGKSLCSLWSAQIFKWFPFSFCTHTSTFISGSRQRGSHVHQ
jgi:hypothetical protein